MYIKIHVFNILKFDFDIGIQCWGHREAREGGKFENLSKTQ